MGVVPWVFFAASAACAVGPRIDGDLAGMSGQLDRLRRQDALRCAPSDLARAEAEVRFARLELRQGNALRAAHHREAADRSVQAVKRGIAECPPPDSDGDGVRDPDDACPQRPGDPEMAGCPDSDGDGVPDHQDRCLDRPEDVDGFEDDDGCPEEEDIDGDGVVGRADACPTVAGPPDRDGCPPGDRDADGFTDAKDRCPTEPEDRDGFEDADGCPDVDNDGDGILDGSDACPLQAETFNGHRDDDGCPDQKIDLVRLDEAKGKLEIDQKVFFTQGRARVSRRSYRLLDQVAQVLRENPSLKVVIEGHTDSSGSASTNLRLSQRRADAVRRRLIRRGQVEPSRLTAIGYGEERPIASNTTRIGREQNRRVEFTITSR
jgi:outer membrane protein OmpA-like peptidoglycan-associated protein